VQLAGLLASTPPVLFFFFDVVRHRRHAVSSLTENDSPNRRFSRTGGQVWAPYLERYAVQLPLVFPNAGDCNPKSKSYGGVRKWYSAMEKSVPAYACRVRVEASVSDSTQIADLTLEIEILVEL